MTNILNGSFKFTNPIYALLWGICMHLNFNKFHLDPKLNHKKVFYMLYHLNKLEFDHHQGSIIFINSIIYVDEDEGECDPSGVKGIWPRCVSPSKRLNV